MEKLIKMGLAVMFLLCLLQMPYGYFQLVRFIALIGFVYLAYSAKKSGNDTAMFIYVALALLFQPFFKLALGRTIWNIVDVIVAIGLFTSAFSNKKNLK